MQTKGIKLSQMLYEAGARSKEKHLQVLESWHQLYWKKEQARLEGLDSQLLKRIKETV